jgi:hypothetical protein
MAGLPLSYLRRVMLSLSLSLSLPHDQGIAWDFLFWATEVSSGGLGSTLAAYA